MRNSTYFIRYINSPIPALPSPNILLSVPQPNPNTAKSFLGVSQYFGTYHILHGRLSCFGSLKRLTGRIDRHQWFPKPTAKQSKYTRWVTSLRVIYIAKLKYFIGMGQHMLLSEGYREQCCRLSAWTLQN